MYRDLSGSLERMTLKAKSLIMMIKLFCDPAEARTQDPQIKSLLLYQLSYGVWYFKEILKTQFNVL